MSAPAATVDDAFAAGDWHRAAFVADPGDWRRHAALGMCGDAASGLAALADFADPEARFYRGILLWIAGEEAAARALLQPLGHPHGDRLLQLMDRPQIRLLTQLPSSRSDGSPHALLLAAENDPRFRVRNIGFDPRDTANAPYAEAARFLDADDPPDLYLAEMLEWHLVPPDIQSLPCPLIAHTADYDLHFHVVRPWLPLFDEVVVTDTSERREVLGLTDAPVTTCAMPFSLPLALPAAPPADANRDIDLLFTGTTFSHFLPDKAATVARAAAHPGLDGFFLNGFLPAPAYWRMLARTRLAVTTTRRPGALPTRGVEALAMAATTIVPEQSVLRLFAGPSDGLHTCADQENDLARALDAALADEAAQRTAAARGAIRIRRIFDPWRAAGHYLRYACFLAARPRPTRTPRPAPLQKRSVAWRGWLQCGTPANHRALRDASLARWKAVAPERHSLETLTNPARELLLEYVREILLPGKPPPRPLLETALAIYRTAALAFPASLALRFNRIRAGLHFGNPEEHAEAQGLLNETLSAAPDRLVLDPDDDVMTWDYCASFFNYRAYFQIAVDAAGGRTDAGALSRLVRASLFHYRGRTTGDAADLEVAVELDPEFSAYRMSLARALCRRSEASDIASAVPHLARLVRDPLFAAEAASLLRAVANGRGLDGTMGMHLAAADRLIDSSFIDEDYVAVRYGPYFRAQRLGLGLNRDFDVRRDTRADASRPRLSILLADTNGCRYPNLPAALANQTLSRDAFEVILGEAFECESPRLRDAADFAFAWGQNEFLFNRNILFNQGLIEARGEICLFLDGDVALPDKALAALLDVFGAGPVDALLDRPDALPYAGAALLAVRRECALGLGGLDESAFHAGALSGPWELALRLQACRKTAHPFEVLSKVRPRPERLHAMLRTFWPDRFSPHRRLPIRENPKVSELRRGAVPAKGSA